MENNFQHTHLILPLPQDSPGHSLLKSGSSPKATHGMWCPCSLILPTQAHSAQAHGVTCCSIGTLCSPGCLCLLLLIFVPTPIPTYVGNTLICPLSVISLLNLLSEQPSPKLPCFIYLRHSNVTIFSCKNTSPLHCLVHSRMQ